jgi:exodeoxyribonuclease X
MWTWMPSLAAHRAAFEQRFCTPRFTGGASWICTWKCELRVWPDLSRSSSQMLRYQRMPKGLLHGIGLPAHRAMPDAYVSAHHLRDLLNETSLQQLFIWSKEPSLLPRVPSSPKRGKGWDRLSEETLRNFLLDRNEDIRLTVESELSRRRKYGTIAITEPAQRSLL